MIEIIERFDLKEALEKCKKGCVVTTDGKEYVHYYNGGYYLSSGVLIGYGVKRALDILSRCEWSFKHKWKVVKHLTKEDNILLKYLHDNTRCVDVKHFETSFLGMISA